MIRSSARMAGCFVAIERNTKLVLAWHLGRRSDDDTMKFTGLLDHTWTLAELLAA